MAIVTNGWLHCRCNHENRKHKDAGLPSSEWFGISIKLSELKIFKQFVPDESETDTLLEKATAVYIENDSFILDVSPSYLREQIEKITAK